MILSKKQKKHFTIIIVIATIGLLLTSFLPFLSAFR
jgi:hypothetical protein